MKKLISRFLIIVFFFILIYIFKKIGIEEIISTISKANPFWILLSFLSIFFLFLFWSLRWRFLLKSKLPLFKFYMLNLVGAFVCTITPSAGAGGEPVKAYYVSKIEKRGFTETFAITLLDKAIFNNLFFIFAVSTSLVYAFLAINLPLEIKSFLSTLFFLLLIALSIILVFKHRWEYLKRPLTKMLLKLYSFTFIKKRFKSFEHFKHTLKKSATYLLKQAKYSLSNKKIFFPALFYTLLAWTFFYLSFYLIFLAINIPINIFHLFIIVTLSKLIGDLAFVPGGIGITESTLLALFILFSVNPVVAATVTIIQRAIFYFYSLVLGYLSLTYLGLKNNHYL
jgi:hypothetical protein